jgi:hypothetical protein
MHSQIINLRSTNYHHPCIHKSFTNNKYEIHYCRTNDPIGIQYSLWSHHITNYNEPKSYIYRPKEINSVASLRKHYCLCMTEFKAQFGSLAHCPKPFALQTPATHSESHLYQYPKKLAINETVCTLL